MHQMSTLGLHSLTYTHAYTTHTYTHHTHTLVHSHIHTIHTHACLHTGTHAHLKKKKKKSNEPVVCILTHGLSSLLLLRIGLGLAVGFAFVFPSSFDFSSFRRPGVSCPALDRIFLQPELCA